MEKQRRSYALRSIIIWVMLYVGYNASAQNVGINATGASPNAWAMLDIAHSTKGLLIPRVGLSALNSAAPIGSGMPASLLVYNIATAGTSPNNVVPGYYYWDGAVWVALAGDGGKNWSLSGNNGTVDGTHFLGTVDNVPLSFRVNNQQAGRIDPGKANVFLGYECGAVSTGANNAGLGNNAFASNTTGSYNTALGAASLYANTTGLGNTACGNSALTNNTIGSYNTAVGGNALARNISGGYNTALGNGALLSNTVGVSNTATGADALTQNQTGNYNAGTGCEALMFNTSGSYNTADGSFAMRYNSTGESNVAVGSSCMRSNTSGKENTAMGRFALYTNQTGSSNTAVGYGALQTNTAGNNTAVGHSALFNNSSGSVNVAVGFNAAYFTSSGYRNVALGYSALYQNSTGSENTAIGNAALQSVTTGSNNIGIGAAANVPVNTNSNQVRIGNTAITYAGVQVAWTITSDQRWKTDIQSSKLGLEFIKGLNPVSYVRKNDPGKKTEYGFIAQEVESLLVKSGAAASGLITKDDEGMLSMRYNDLLAPMVKAIQEQQAMIEELKLRNRELERRLKALEKN